MPVQINEVIIKAVVDGNSNASNTAAPLTETGSQGISSEDIASRVIEIIKEKNER
jgi:Family of unknown function (DUF5908)